MWEYNKKEGWYFIYEDEINTEDTSDSEEYEKTFHIEIKFKKWWFINSFLPHYLEDIEEFELDQSHIELLDGVAYCKPVFNFNLYYNKITGISELNTLNVLEELYLGNNKIGYIDALSSLFELRLIEFN